MKAAILGVTMAGVAGLLAPTPSEAGVFIGFGWHGGGRDIRYFHHHDFHIWRRGHWVHGWHEGHFGWWWLAAGTWYFYPAPVYPYPDPYVPPPVVIETPPPVVQAAPPPPPPQQVAPAPPPTAANNWYYCKNPEGYYPYVPSCPGGWTAVPATPPTR